MSINGDFGADFIHYARSSRYQRQNPTQHTSGNARRPHSTTFSTTDEMFTDDEIYFFMVIKLKPAQARQILRDDPPPHEFYDMDAVVKAGYLFYYGVYKQHFPYDMQIFVKRFYKEFYKYTCENMSDEEALKKICNHTYKEWQRNHQKEMSERYRMMNDGRSTPDSRTSLSSFEDSDLMSLDSAAKEPLKFRTHHALVRFGPGGRLVILAPRESISTIRIDHFKNHVANRSLRRNIDLVESFKGPLIYNETQPHTLQLFIERQIRDIYNSDVYKGNPDSNDTNDCLLIWRLLQMLIKQQGRVTGPDLAQLLIEDNQLDDDNNFNGNKSPLISQPSFGSANNDASDLAECTNFLLRGCVEEAINSAIQEGCLFDALILAESLYVNRPDKLQAIRARLLATRSAQHPLSTLISVAETKPVPLLASTNTGDGKGWRAHVAILLANLQTRMAYDSIYRLGLDLAKKEFNSAADFCFLAVYLLSGYDCFAPPAEQSSYRQHISLIHATLPDDNVHAACTTYGWSILDFCATEIFEFASRLVSGGQPTALSKSPIMLQRRYEYAQMLDSFGGFADSVRAYCQPQGVQPTYQLPAQNSFEPIKPTQPLFTPTQATFQIQQYPSTSSKPSEAETNLKPSVEAKKPEAKPVKPEIQEHDVKTDKSVADTKSNASNQPPSEPQTPKQHQQSPLKSQTMDSFGGFADNVQAFSQSQASQPFSQPLAQNSFESVKPTQPTQPSFTSTQTHFQNQYPSTLSKPSKSETKLVKSKLQEFDVNAGRPMNDRHTSASNQQPSESQTRKQHHQQSSLKPNANENKEGSLQKGGGGSSGWLGGLFSKVVKSKDEMILPSDKDIPENEKIRWDPTLNRYVGGIEEEVAPPPPPSLMPTQSSAPALIPTSQEQQPASPSFAQTTPQQQPMPSNVNAQQPAKSSTLRRGANRYSNAFSAAGGATTSSDVSAPSMIPEMSMAPPTNFGFIPMAAEGDDQESPFSQAAVDPNQQSRETSQESN